MLPPQSDAAASCLRISGKNQQKRPDSRLMDAWAWDLCFLQHRLRCLTAAAL